MSSYKVGDKGIYHFRPEGVQPAMDMAAEITKVNDDGTYELKYVMPDGTVKVEHDANPEQFEIAA